MKTKSLLRREQYKALSQITIDGEILDVGGSKKSGYHELIKGQHTIVTGNIDESYGTDLVFDAQETWPFSNNSFDSVLMINLLEHLYVHDVALQEAYRVLKTNGRIIGAVPFLINVHGSPNDYFRYTKESLQRKLMEKGFADIQIKEQGTGAFSVVYHCLIGFVRFNWMADVLIPFFMGLDRLVLAAKPDNKMSSKQMPLGYFFQATKR